LILGSLDFYDTVNLRRSEIHIGKKRRKEEEEEEEGRLSPIFVVIEGLFQRLISSDSEA